MKEPRLITGVHFFVAVFAQSFRVPLLLLFRPLRVPLLLLLVPLRVQLLVFLVPLRVQLLVLLKWDAF